MSKPKHYARSPLSTDLVYQSPVDLVSIQEYGRFGGREILGHI